MRIDQLECLITINRFNSISAASNELHLTPQAVSTSIKNLEKELDMTLLLRTSKYTMLTDEGKKVVQATEHFLGEIAEIKNASSRQADCPALVGEVKIFSSQGICERLLPKIICNFMKTSPDLTIHLQKEKETQLLHKALQQEEAVTILFFSTEYISKTKRPEYLDRLEFFPLFQSRLVAQIPIDNPLSSYQSVSLKSILKYPILLNDASANIVELLQRYGQPEQLIFETNQSIYQEMLCQGMGLSLSLAIPFEPTTTFVSNRVRSVPIKDDIHTDCCYVLQKDARYSEVMMDFLEQMTSWFTENSYPYPSFIL